MVSLRHSHTYIASTLLFLLFVAGAGLAAALPGASAAPLPQVSDGTESLPPGVSVQTVLEDMDQPVAMAFDPDGRLFYTEKDTGKVRLYANGRLRPNPVINFDVDGDFERGLLGIAVDPDFSRNRYIYVYYTCATGEGCLTQENRLVRFVERDGVGSNPTTIFTSPQTAGNHVGGNIHFGPDGKLYVTVGDSARASNSQSVAVKNGKLHRINPDGSAPEDNPTFSQPGALPSLYAMGLRNSFDFTFDPIVKGRIFASENGPGCDDEMNRIEAGYNYGWRDNYPCDNANPDPAFNSIRPLWYLGQGACCLAPTGIEVYTGGQIPQWRDHLFMGNYEGGALYHFYLNSDRTALTAASVVRGVRANMDIETGPDGALWYIEGGGYRKGTLKRLVGPGEQGTTATPTAAPPVVSTATVHGTGSRTFPETGKTVSGLFLDYWNAHGGLAQQGFPISGVVTEVSDLDGKPYTVQYFERAVFEHHSENRPPYDVLLSQLGALRYKKKYPNGAPGEQTNKHTNPAFFPETGKRLGGRFLRYWQENGGLMQQGYPISDEFTEVSDLDGKPYTVQYFERAIFELHPENQPPYDVLLSQLGTFRYNEKASKDRAGL